MSEKNSRDKEINPRKEEEKKNWFMPGHGLAIGMGITGLVVAGAVLSMPKDDGPLPHEEKSSQDHYEQIV